MERILASPLKAGGDHVRMAGDGYHVATVSRGMNDRAEYARLFAAAPDMLAALISAVQAHGPFGDDARPAWWQAACDAIAKATEGRANG